MDSKAKLRFVEVPIYLLLAIGVFFTVRFGFIQFRAMRRAMKVTFAKPEPGQISSFQAFATGLASRVGTAILLVWRRRSVSAAQVLCFGCG